MKLLIEIGRYFIMLSYVFRFPEKGRVFRKRVMAEIQEIGVGSIPLVALLSVFIGAVIALQTASNMDSPLLPAYTVGYITQSSTILEFSPTVISLILSGKIGSNITSEIGTMRISEQIDALDIMGINSLNYIVLPKIVVAIFFFPVLIILSMALSMTGGWIALTLSGLVSTETYILGLRTFFLVGNIWYALTKCIVFGFIIVSISAFFGYYTKGGSIEVGKSSTKAVVANSVVILIANFLLTQLILF